MIANLRVDADRLPLCCQRPGDGQPLRLVGGLQSEGERDAATAHIPSLPGAPPAWMSAAARR